MLTLITSPMCAYLHLLPPRTLMHITCRTPVLSATSSIVCIWIIAISNLIRPAASEASRLSTARVLHHLRRPVLEPVRVTPPAAHGCGLPAAGNLKLWQDLCFHATLFVQS